MCCRKSAQDQRTRINSKVRLRINQIVADFRCRIEILQTSTRDIAVIDRELQNLKKALADLR